jgi:uncharacterized protein
VSETPLPRLDVEPTEDELETLDLFLDSSEPNEGLPLDAVEGMMAAVACGPVTVLPSAWMAAIWGGQVPDFDSLDEGQKILETLLRLYNSTVREIAAGSYSPMITTYEGEDGEELDDPQDWCLGFQEGMMLCADAWEGRLKTDPVLQQLLAPIMAIADPDDEIRAAFESKDEREKIMDDIAASVVDLRDYWIDRPV